MALAPHADEAAISKLYSTIRPYLEVSHGGREPRTTTPGASGGSLRCVCVRGMSLSLRLAAAQDRVFICFLVAWLPSVSI